MQIFEGILFFKNKLSCCRLSSSRNKSLEERHTLPQERHFSGRIQPAAAKLVVCFCIVREFEGEDSVEKIAFCLVLHGCKIVIE